jgi:hypothetical protein
MAKDGPIHTVPKLYDYALDVIKRKSIYAYEAIERMQLCGASSFALKSAIFAAFSVWRGAQVPWVEDYEQELMDDLAKRHQQEIFKYVPFEEAS